MKKIKRKIVAHKERNFQLEGVTYVLYYIALDNDNLVENLPPKLIFDMEYLPSTLKEYMEVFNLTEEEVINMLRLENDD